MHTKRFNTFFKRWVQFRVGAIPRLPIESFIEIGEYFCIKLKCIHRGVRE